LAEDIVTTMAASHSAAPGEDGIRHMPPPPDAAEETAPEPGPDPGEEEATPAGRFAPSPIPPVPQTLVVRQTGLRLIVAVMLILGLAGAGLLGWQLYLLRGELAQVRMLTARIDRISAAVSGLSDAATQANEIANQALVNSSRPWIGVDTVETGPVMAGQPLDIEVRVRNSGRTPSTDMQGLFLVYILPVSRPPSLLRHPCRSCLRSVVLPNGIVTYKLSVRSTVMTADEAQRIKAGTDTMWIVGRLDYNDGDGEPHTTQSCLYYRASAAAGFTTCDEGNSAD
jgi:hypothetical protein